MNPQPPPTEQAHLPADGPATPVAYPAVSSLYPAVSPAVETQPTWRRQELAQTLDIDLPPAIALDRRPWHAVVCSHLGRSLRQRHVSLAVLLHWTQFRHQDGAAQLLVRGTAAAPWVDRACQLLGIRPVALALAGDRASVGQTKLNTDVLTAVERTGLPSSGDDVWHVPVAGHPLDRDALAILFADTVDVVWLRAGGRIHHWLKQRVEADATLGRPSGVRILMPTCAAGHELMAAGAIGGVVTWPAAAEVAEHAVSADDAEHAVAAAPSPIDALPPTVAELVQHPDRWLIHCTRGVPGVWPGQSQQQFRDSLLLTAPHEHDGTPLQTLRRIVAQQQLIGWGQTIRGGHPVVCCSDRPLLQIVAGRRYRSHLGRWDAEPYGIAIRKTTAIAHGARPVVYCEADRDAVDPMPIGSVPAWLIQPVGRRRQWVNECEWRLPGTLNLRQWLSSDAVVFVATDPQRTSLGRCRWPVVSAPMLARLAGSPTPPFNDS